MWEQNLFEFFFFGHTTQQAGILVPQPGIEPTPPAVEAQSLNHWTTREVPVIQLLKIHDPRASLVAQWLRTCLPMQAGDTGSRPGPGRSHMLRSN